MIDATIIYWLTLPVVLIVIAIKVHHDKSSEAKRKAASQARYAAADKARAEGRCVLCAIGDPHVEHQTSAPATPHVRRGSVRRGRGATTHPGPRTTASERGTLMPKPTTSRKAPNPEAYSQCRALGHEWRHRPPARDINSTMILQSSASARTAPPCAPGT